MALKSLGNCARRSRPEKRIKHDIAGFGASKQDSVEQCLWLLRRVRLGAAALNPFSPAANWEAPVRTHLQLIIKRLHRAVVEGIARVLAL